jgi:hypothetical protein
MEMMSTKHSFRERSLTPPIPSLALSQPRLHYWRGGGDAIRVQELAWRFTWHEAISCIVSFISSYRMHVVVCRPVFGWLTAVAILVYHTDQPSLLRFLSGNRDHSYNMCSKHSKEQREQERTMMGGDWRAPTCCSLKKFISNTLSILEFLAVFGLPPSLSWWSCNRNQLSLQWTENKGEEWFWIFLLRENVLWIFNFHIVNMSMRQ